MTLRPFSVADAPELARLHRRYVPGSTFASFGYPFLKSLYRGLARSPTGIGYVLPGAGKLEAYITATTDSERLFRDILLREGLSLGGRLLLGLQAPARTWRAVRDTLRYSAATRVEGVGAEYLFIAVEPPRRGGGLARELILKVRDEMKRRGVKQAKVVILEDNITIRTILLETGFFQPLYSFTLWEKRFCLLLGTL